MNVQSHLVSSVMVAGEQHLPGAKQLADQHKRELGFVNREILRKAIAAQSLLVALTDCGVPTQLAGMLHFYQRRDDIVTLYSIAVAEPYRRYGIGSLLFEELVHIAHISGKAYIRLKCPTDLPANLFYEKLGLELITVEEGKQRPLNVWCYKVSKQHVFVS